MRHMWRWFIYRVFCDGCGWTAVGKNGLGIAAQHHDRTGHSVHVDVEGQVGYLNDVDHAEQEKIHGVQNAER